MSAINISERQSNLRAKKLRSYNLKTGFSKAGFSLVEVILAVSLFALIVTGFVGAYLYGEEATFLSGQRARAVMLAKEGIEAVRNIRDSGFSNLVDGTYGLTLSGNQWNLSGASDVTDIFTRQIVIAPTGANRKTVTSNVTWQQNPQRSGAVLLTTRLTNWLAYVVGDWSNPFQEAVVNLSADQDGRKVQIVGDYAYMVRNGGTPDFAIIDKNPSATPSLVGSLSLPGVPRNVFVSGAFAYVASSADSQELQIIDVSIPSSPNVVGTYNAPGSADANGIFVDGAVAYLVRSGSGNDEFLAINVSSPSSPSFADSLDLAATAYEVALSGAFAYVASGNNSQELQVVDVSVPSSLALAGSLNVSGTTDAITVALSGTTAFLGRGNNLYTINITSPTSPAQIGSLGVGNTLNDIALNLGNNAVYVYIATSQSSAEFQVIDVSSLSTPTQLGLLNISGGNPLLGVAYDSTFDRAFAVGQSNASEFVVIAPQ